MLRYQPIKDFTDSDSGFLTGRALTPAEARKIEQNLKINPDDLRGRLLLIDRNFPERPIAYMPHLIWTIDHYPKHCIHQIALPHKKDAAYKKGRQSWLKHVQSNPDDVTILCHAAHYLKILAPQDSIRFLRKASDLDSLNDDLPRQLSHMYRMMAELFSPRKNKLMARNAAKQMKIAVERYACPNDGYSYLQHYFRMELQNVAELALTCGLLDDARDLGQLLLNHKSINTQRFISPTPGETSTIYELSEHAGHSVLGRIAVASDRTIEAKKHLQSMLKVPLSTFVDWKLANELLQIGEVAIASAYIEHFRKEWERRTVVLQNKVPNATKEDKQHALEMEAWLSKWLKQIKHKRGAKTSRSKTR